MPPRDRVAASAWASARSEPGRVTRPLVIVNPAAGGGRTRRLWPGLREELRRLRFTFDEAETTGPGEALRLAVEARERSVPLVVAVGGDGTLGEVVSGVVDRDRPAPAVSAVMTGRGRDACRNLGLARNPHEAIRRLVGAEEVAVDVGVARFQGGSRCVVNAAGAGFDAVVAGEAAQGGGGQLAYLRAVLRSLRAFQPVEVRVVADGRDVVAGPVTAVVVANGAYFGAGMKVAPGAAVQDGWLDLVVLGALGRAELVRWLPTLYWGGHLRHPAVRQLRARSVTISALTPVPAQIDGEACAETPLEITAAPGALRLRR